MLLHTHQDWLPSTLTNSTYACLCRFPNFVLCCFIVCFSKVCEFRHNTWHPLDSESKSRSLFCCVECLTKGNCIAAFLGTASPILNSSLPPWIIPVACPTQCIWILLQGFQCFFLCTACTKTIHSDKDSELGRSKTPPKKCKSLMSFFLNFTLHHWTKSKQRLNRIMKKRMTEENEQHVGTFWHQKCFPYVSLVFADDSFSDEPRLSPWSILVENCNVLLILYHRKGGFSCTCMHWMCICILQQKWVTPMTADPCCLRPLSHHFCWCAHVVLVLMSLMAGIPILIKHLLP